MYIIYIYTIIYVIGWRFCCCFYPPQSWFLLVCLGDKVYLPGSRWFQPSDSTAPVFLSLPTRWAVGLLTKWPTNLEALVPLAGHLKIRSFPTKSANCQWVGSMEFSVVLTTRSWGFCARLPFIQVLKSWTPTKNWIGIIYRTFWNFIPSIYPPT